MDQISAVLSHEWVHLRRKDLWFLLIQRGVECLVFFHPATWWLSQCANRYREESCDDLVISSGCSKSQYVDALLRMAELYLEPQIVQQAIAASAGGATRSEFRNRILRLMGETPMRKLSIFSVFFYVAVCVVLFSVGATWLVAQGVTKPQSVVEIKSGTWPQWGGNSHRNNAMEGNVVTEWSFESGENLERVIRLGKASYFAPVVAEDRVLVGTLERDKNGKEIPCLKAFDRASGEWLWSYESSRLKAGRKQDWPGFGMCSTPAVENGPSLLSVESV